MMFKIIISKKNSLNTFYVKSIHQVPPYVMKIKSRKRIDTNT